MIDKCDCGRQNCDYFDPSEGEYGVSYSKKSLPSYIEDKKNEILKLEKWIKKAQKFVNEENNA